MPVKFRPIAQLPQEYFDIFWPYVLMGERTECWPWLGAENAAGYGQFFAERKLWIAHRIAYFLHFGVDPLALDVCHKCDNPPCCNPWHLFLGTAQDNTNDCVRKGRHRTNPHRGEAAQNSKLTEEAVRQIRILRQQGVSTYKLAAQFNVGAMTVWNAAHGKSWRHI